MDGLLTDAQDFAFSAGRDGAVGAIEAEGGFDSVPIGVLGGAAELDGEGVFSGVLRAKSPYGLTGIGETLADMLASGVEMADGGFGLVVAKKFGEDFELDRDADVALGEGVVDFAGDAVALGEDGAEFALGAKEAETEGEEYESGGEGEKKKVEPDGLVEMRLQLEGEGCAGCVPEAVIVRCLNAEGVIARRNAGVVGGAARTGVGLLMIEALEHVTVADFLRSGEAEAGVVELEVIVACRDFERCVVQWLVEIVNGESDEGDRGRDGVDGEMGGVDLDEAFWCGEPEKPVAGPPSGWVAVGGHLPGAKTVGGTEFHPVRTAPVHATPATKTCRGGPGVVAITAGDAAGCSEPKMLLAGRSATSTCRRVVVEDGVDGGLVEARVRDWGEGLAVPEIPAVILRADEEIAVGARKQRGDDVAGEAVGGGKVRDSELRAVGQAGETGESCNPEVAICIARHGADQIAAEASGLRVGFDVEAGA